MIFAHLPAGYLISRCVYRKLGCDAVSRAAFVLAGLVGAVAPDFDFAYFFLVDGRQHHHHTYFTHFPVFWLALIVVSAIWFCATRFRFVPALALIFACNGFVHLLLDSIAGGIAWLAPWSIYLYSLSDLCCYLVPESTMNFVHLSWALEVSILLCAYGVWRSSLDGERILHLLQLPQFHLLRLRVVPIRPKD